MVKNTVLEIMTEFSHYNGGFWVPLWDLDILSQPAVGGIPSMCQHRVLSIFVLFWHKKNFKKLLIQKHDICIL